MVKRMKCHVDIPYPKICVVKKNPEIARMIMHSYAGNVSEDTAIHQYMYQSVLLQEEEPEIAIILESIGKVEMHHLEILATLIKALGVYPIYLDPIVDKHEFWSSKYVSYETELRPMLEADILAEQEAIAQYNSLIHVIHDSNVQAILKRIVLDERMHLEIFEKILESIS